MLLPCIHVSISKAVHSLSMAVTGLELSLIDGSIRPSVGTTTLSLVLKKLRRPLRAEVKFSMKLDRAIARAALA